MAAHAEEYSDVPIRRMVFGFMPRDVRPGYPTLYLFDGDEVRHGGEPLMRSTGYPAAFDTMFGIRSGGGKLDVVTFPARVRGIDDFGDRIADNFDMPVPLDFSRTHSLLFGNTASMGRFMRALRRNRFHYLEDQACHQYFQQMLRENPNLRSRYEGTWIGIRSESHTAPPKFYAADVDPRALYRTFEKNTPDPTGALLLRLIKPSKPDESGEARQSTSPAWD